MTFFLPLHTALNRGVSRVTVHDYPKIQNIYTYILYSCFKEHSFWVLRRQDVTSIWGYQFSETPMFMGTSPVRLSRNMFYLALTIG